MTSTLTKKQLEVVIWLVTNGHEDDPAAAVKAGLISSNGLYGKWGLANVKNWCDEYKADLPPAPMTQEEVHSRITSLVPSAVTTIQQTLQRGKGDRVAVDLAKWVLAEVYTPKPVQKTPAIPPEQNVSAGEAELLNILSFKHRA